MPSTLAKITIGATGIAGITGGGVGTYLLLQDKTIEDRLKRQGKVLIQESKQYQIAFKELKSKPEFIQTINNEYVKSDSDHNIGGAALRDWCKEKLTLPLTSENLNNLLPKVSDYCTIPPLTIGEKIDRNGKKLVSDWNTKFKLIKSSARDLQTDLNNTNKEVTDINQTNQESKAIKALEKWCKDQIELNLLSTNVEETWTKVETRCIENKNS